MSVEQGSVQTEKIFKPAWYGWGVWVPDQRVNTAVTNTKGEFVENIKGFRAEYPAEEWINPDREKIVAALGAVTCNLEFDRSVAGDEFWLNSYSDGSSIETWFGSELRTETLTTPDHKVVELSILRKLPGPGLRSY